MTLLALSIAFPMPWEFILIVGVSLATSPILIQRYARIHWRVPYWHLLVAAAVVALATCYAVQHVRTIHKIDESYYRWDHEDAAEWSAAEAEAKVRFTPVSQILLELGVISFVPGLFAAVIIACLLEFKSQLSRT